jgi:predicted LPLAT superfamily acyltransferase
VIPVMFMLCPISTNFQHNVTILLIYNLLSYFICMSTHKNHKNCSAEYLTLKIRQNEGSFFKLNNDKHFHSFIM